MSKEELEKVTQDYSSFTAAKDEWLSSQPTAARPPPKTSKRDIVRITKLDHRISIGLDFLRWHEDSSKDSSKDSSEDSSKVNRKWDEYCKYKWAYKGVVPKNIKMWVSRCVALATPIASGKQVWKCPTARQRKFGLRPRELRLRSFGSQGRPLMAPMLREATFDWFLSIRASVAQRISAKVVLKQAKVYFKMMVGEMARTGVFANMPILDSQWLRRWKKDYWTWSGIPISNHVFVLIGL